MFIHVLCYLVVKFCSNNLVVDIERNKRNSFLLHIVLVNKFDQNLNKMVYFSKDIYNKLVTLILLNYCKNGEYDIANLKSLLTKTKTTVNNPVLKIRIGRVETVLSLRLKQMWQDGLPAL